MLQARRQLDLALEPLGAERSGHVVVENLERYRAVVPEIVGEVDDSEAAPSMLTIDPVSARQRLGERLEFWHGDSAVGERPLRYMRSEQPSRGRTASR